MYSTYTLNNSMLEGIQETLLNVILIFTFHDLRNIYNSVELRASTYTFIVFYFII